MRNFFAKSIMRIQGGIKNATAEKYLNTSEKICKKKLIENKHLQYFTRDIKVGTC